jgi:hypothetical protein
MKARNGTLALLAVLALAGCSVDTAPTEPGAAPRYNEDGPGTLGSGARAGGTSTAADTAAARGITLGSGA